MNDVSKEVLQQILKLILDTATDAKGFAVEQLPDVAQQWIAYNFWASIAWAVSYLLLAMLLAGFAAKAVTWWKLTVNDIDSPWPYVTILCGPASILSIVAVIYNVSWAAKLYLAPKVCVIEWITEMVKNST